MTMKQIKAYFKGVFSGLFPNYATIKKLSSENGVLKFKDTPVIIPPTGTITLMVTDTVPEGYVECDGSILNISDYRKLAGYIKNKFGSYNYFGGNGTTTFGIPGNILNPEIQDVKALIKT